MACLTASDLPTAWDLRTRIIPTTQKDIVAASTMFPAIMWSLNYPSGLDVLQTYSGTPLSMQTHRVAQFTNALHRWTDSLREQSLLLFQPDPRTYFAFQYYLGRRLET